MPSTIRGSDNMDSAQVSPVLGTSQSASGTAVDFTGIPSWVKRITVMFNGVSTNGSSGILIQIGSGSVQVSGYTGSGSLVFDAGTPQVSSYTTGFGIRAYANAAQAVSGAIRVVLLTGNTYVAEGTVTRTDAAAGGTTAGNVSLSGVLDRLRITTANGTDTFDAGTINIMWE